jgi:hypothetical protein
MSSSTPALVRRACLLCAAGLSFSLGGCAVIAVTGTVVGVAATGAGLAVDAAVGTVKAVGSVAGAVLPGGDDKK